MPFFECELRSGSEGSIDLRLLAALRGRLGHRRGRRDRRHGGLGGLAKGRVLEREEDEDGGVRLAVSLSAQALGQFEQLFPQAEVRAR